MAAMGSQIYAGCLCRIPPGENLERDAALDQFRGILLWRFCWTERLESDIVKGTSFTCTSILLASQRSQN